MDKVTKSVIALYIIHYVPLLIGAGVVAIVIWAIYSFA